MFGNSKPVVFRPYGRRRSNRRPPRWLVLLLAGIAAGAAAVILVQERYLPPRLSADASAQVTRALEQSERERQGLAGELTTATTRLDVALVNAKRLAEELAASQAKAAQLRDDLATAVAALPPDPRGGAVEVRAGRFTAQGGVLDYEMVLTRPAGAGKSAAKPWVGVMQLVLDGDGERGSPGRITLKATALSIDGLRVLRGSQPLPDDFKPRQATIQVLDRNAAQLLGMRVLRVNGPA
jgi:hypothetical protein